MNINDLQQGSYKVISNQPQKLNINNLPQGSYKPVEQTELKPKENNMFQKLAINLVGRPAIRTTQALVGLGVEAFGSPQTKERFYEAIQKPTDIPILGRVEGTKAFGQGGGKQLALESAKSAFDIATLGYGSAINKGLTTGATKLLKPALPQLAKTKAGTFVAKNLPQVAANLTEGLGYQAGYNVLNERPITEGMKTAGTLSVILPPAIQKGLPKLISATKAGAKETFQPSKIMQRVVRISKGKQQKFKQTAGEEVGEYLAKRGIFKGPQETAEELTKRWQTSKQGVDDTLEKLPGTFKHGALDDMIDELVEREVKVSSPNVKSPDFNTVINLANKNSTTGLSHTEANLIKRLYERNVKLDYLRSNLPEKIARANNIDSAVRNAQVEEAAKHGFKNLREMNRETRLAKMLADDIGKEYSGKLGNDSINLTDWIVLSGGEPTNIAAFFAKKIGGSKRVQTGVAKLLSPFTPQTPPIKPNLGPSTIKRLAAPKEGAPQSSIYTPIKVAPPKSQLEIISKQGIGDYSPANQANSPTITTKPTINNIPPIISQKANKVKSKKPVTKPQSLKGKGEIPTTKESLLKKALKDNRGFVSNAPIKSGLTTKFLEYAKGKTTLSRQEILDFARRPELKKGEADLLLKKLEEFEPKGQKVFSGGSEITKEWSNDKIGGFGTIFRGKNELGGGIYVTDSPEYAKTFGSQLTESSIKDNLKLFDVRESSKAIGNTTLNKIKNGFNYEYYLKNGGKELSSADYPDEILNKIQEVYGGNSTDILKKAGFDGIVADESRIGGQGGTVWNIFDAKNIKTQSSKIPAQDFADSIRRDLLELKPVKVKDPQYGNTTIQAREYGQARGGDVSPAELDAFEKSLKGKNYEEVVFESPITTNGSSHFPNSKNYFAHARGDEVVESGKKIWREQEIQSDVLQKEGLEQLKPHKIDYSYLDATKIKQKPNNGLFYVEDARGEPVKFAETKQQLIKDLSGEYDKKELKRLAEVEKLSPFTNDRFGERIMRERIKEKASKGYSKYRLPTGETIGKIEGFETMIRHIVEDGKAGTRLTPQNAKVGMEFADTLQGLDVMNRDKWIITDILGDGRFKAVPKELLEDKKWSLDFFESEEARNKAISGLKETFDLTGKSNPQAKRYENWGKFLKNKYGAKQITDPQGNSWYEIDLKPEYAKEPVYAFGQIQMTPLIGMGISSAGIVGGVNLLKRIKDKQEAKKLEKENKKDLLNLKKFDREWLAKEMTSEKALKYLAKFNK